MSDDVDFGIFVAAFDRRGRQVNGLAVANGVLLSASIPEVSYSRYRFPPSVIRRAVWLSLRVPMSCRDVADLLFERGLDVSYEAARQADQDDEPEDWVKER